MFLEALEWFISEERTANILENQITLADITYQLLGPYEGFEKLELIEFDSTAIDRHTRSLYESL